jgi:hypothetical protein
MWLIQLLEVLQGTFTSHAFNIIRMEEKISNNSFHDGRIDENTNFIRLRIQVGVDGIDKGNFNVLEELLLGFFGTPPTALNEMW